MIKQTTKNNFSNLMFTSVLKIYCIISALDGALPVKHSYLQARNSPLEAAIEEL